LAWALILFLQSLVAQHVVIVLPLVGEAERQAAEQGCRRGLGEGHCQVESQAAAVGTGHRVFVAWDAEQLEATLTFEAPATALEPAKNAEVMARSLRFDVGDPPAARYEAIGLVVAAHVMAWVDAQAASSPGPDASVEAAHDQDVVAQGTAREPPEPGPLSAVPPWMAELGLGMGHGLQQGPARFLLSLAAGRTLLSGPNALSAVLELQLSDHFSEPQVTWMSAGLGGELTLLQPSPDLSFALRVAAVLERFAARATLEGEEAAGQRLRYGARGRFSLQYCFFRGVCGFMAVQAEALWPAVRLEVSGESAGKQWIRGLDGLIGLRIRG